VALNAGSNTVTLVSDFVGPSAATLLLDAGGSFPIAGAAGDFNGDGVLDQVVADNGGDLAVLLCGDAGLSLAQTRTLGDLLHPTDLALAGFGNDAVTVYMTAAGLERTVIAWRPWARRCCSVRDRISWSVVLRLSGACLRDSRELVWPRVCGFRFASPVIAGCDTCPTG